MEWYKSKIIWFNILSALLMIIDSLLTTGLIPTQYLIYVTMIVNVVNIVLRTFFSTGNAIERKDKYNQL